MGRGSEEQARVRGARGRWPARARPEHAVVGAVTSLRADLAESRPVCIGQGAPRPARKAVARPETWHGSSTIWQKHLERGLVRRHPGQVTVSDHDWGYFKRDGGRLRVYKHTGLYVPGRVDLIPVRIEFHERPTYATYGLGPQDYPRVFADPGAASKHRMPNDDALCLYHPDDPTERRWTAPDGMVSLLNIVVNHLFCELRWRNTGGADGGVWPLDEAPHGYVTKDAS